MSTVLVTGGAGFIGSASVAELLAHGHRVAVLDDLSSGRRENLPEGAELFVADVADAGSVRAVFRQVRPERVLHLAAQISVSRSVREPAADARVNVVGLLHVLEAAREAGTRRVVFASSGGVLYGEVERPAVEEQALAPISPYGIAKWAGERYLEFFAREHGIEGVALRYGNVYGPRQDPHGEAGVVAIFSGRLLAGEPPQIHGDGENVRDYVYVEDVARANRLALEAEAGSLLPGGGAPFVAFNVGTGRGTTVNRLVALMRQALAEVAGGDAPAAVHGPARPGDLRSSLLDPGRIGRRLDWRPQVALEEGLRRTLRWFAARREAIAPAGDAML
ncbi:MAG: NAD-dependent epimerase/dehydratase family protein [Bacillota bacterium]|nr:NAD-dependent epimerase/dehydratase family protein [Bacillota bacterium]